MEKQILMVTLVLRAPASLSLVAVAEYARASVERGGSVLMSGDPAREISDVSVAEVRAAPGEIERLRHGGDSLR